MALFQFELAPVESILPWGTPPDLSLPWFGLSDGTYHIDLGENRLLEYSQRDGWPRFVDYQLARIHEDILEMLPRILEPIPASIARHFVDGRLGSTFHKLNQNWEETHDDDASIDLAVEALGSRQLDTAYLNLGPRIWVWSFGEKTIIEWDNRNCLVEGTPLWTAVSGTYELMREDFLNEVQDFHLRLMTAMAERVETVCSNWNRPDVRVDFALLKHEQLTRSAQLDLAMHHIPIATDWGAVESALARS